MNNDRFTYDFFIGYASPDKEKAGELHKLLLNEDYKVFLDADIQPGELWVKSIEEKQKSSRVQVFLISKNTSKAHYQLDEIALAIDIMLKPCSTIRVVPVCLPEENGPGSFPDVPYGLRVFQRIQFDPETGMPGIVDKLRTLVPRQGKSPSSLGLLVPGVGCRDDVFNKSDHLPDIPVFAVELLTQPVILEKRNNDRKRRTQVNIDRTGVKNAVYTTEGKNWLCREFLKGKIDEWAKKKDKEIHNFLIKGKPNTSFSLPLHNFPLRWASGGVLSIVKISGREGLWTPFFFRDIPPVGWNISLGASESNDELNNPWGFLLREFLEETLILSPAGSTTTRMVKTFEVGPARDGFMVERKRANEFSQQHRALRCRTDAVNFQLQLNDANYIIPCDLVKTMTDIHIHSHDGNDAHVWKDVIVCFNLLELGIEVIKVLEYELAEDDQILDGEILDRQDKNTGEKWQELVRMPVALISHRFLKQVFGFRTRKFEPHYPELYRYIDGSISGKPEQVKQPCLFTSKPGPDDIIIFHWDAVRRKEICDCIINKDELSVHPSDRKAFNRHMLWQKNFGDYFLDQKGKPISTNPAPYFTYASAKAMNCYFANKK